MLLTISGETLDMSDRCSLRISIPEIMVACSCVLFLSQMNIIASIFLCLGVIGAIFRFSIDAHFDQLRLKREQASSETLMKTFFSLVEAARSRAESSDSNSPDNYN